ncbi:MAG: phage terminase large subunit [Acetatifactor sp.]
MRIAEQYKEKVNTEKAPDKYKAARESSWEYVKLKNPKFYKEDRWHLKQIEETLQALVEDRIIKLKNEDEWHIATVKEVQELDREAVRYNICKKLMLNIPPRHGKSYNLQEFEQWYLAKNPEGSVITVSYNDILSGRFSANVRDGIDATKIDRNVTIFSDIFPNVKIKEGDGAKNIWSLVGRFFSYLGTGFGGTITGVGCYLGVIDDPIKNDKEAFNDNVMESQYSWYTDTFLSRIEEGGYQIINMTRWSTKDLCGRLLEAEPGEWYQLCYPACLNADKIYRMDACKKSRELDRCQDCAEYPCGEYEGEPMDEDGNIIGQMLCPELLSFETWLKKRRIMSNPIFMANYQQQPVDVTNALYAQGFKTYETAVLDRESFERSCCYADTADEGVDYLCAIYFGVIDRYAYVTDVYYTDASMEKTEPETARRMKQQRTKEAMIESNNGGRGFARNVARILKGWGWKLTCVTWFTQSRNKKARILSHATNVCEQVIMPEDWDKRWPEFHKHVMGYQRKGKNEHDDAEDCLTGVVEMVNGEIKAKKKVRGGKKSRYGIR